MPEEPMMTEAQRDELKTLCAKADVPDKTGERTVWAWRSLPSCLPGRSILAAATPVCEIRTKHSPLTLGSVRWSKITRHCNR